VLRTVRYEYIQQTGNVAHITIKDTYDPNDPNLTPNDPNDYLKYHDLWLAYAPSGTLFRAIWQEWHDQRDPNDPNDPNGYGPWWQYEYSGGWRYPVELARDRVTDAWEFHFDSGRERYFARHYYIDPNDADPAHTFNTNYWIAQSTAGTDYLNQQPYADYSLANPNVPVEVTRYLAGYGVHQAETLGSPGSTTGFQGDMIRSTMLLTDSNNGGAAVSDVTAYTAFGELVTPNSELGTRYAYAGGWGYESGYITLQGVNTSLAPITLQHVGWRWYQPGIGRFVQRDPIGIRAGTNAYLYCCGRPTIWADPLGLINDGAQTWPYVPGATLPLPKGIIIGGETKGPIHAGPAVGGGVDVGFDGSVTPFCIATSGVDIWDVAGAGLGGIVELHGGGSPPTVTPIGEGHLGPFWVIGGAGGTGGSFIGGGIGIGPFFGGVYWD
jgi:RHS repeat-associated protein